jgi:hypothetical protein
LIRHFHNTVLRFEKSVFAAWTIRLNSVKKSCRCVEKNLLRSRKIFFERSGFFLSKKLGFQVANPANEIILTPQDIVCVKKKAQQYIVVSSLKE